MSRAPEGGSRGHETRPRGRGRFCLLSSQLPVASLTPPNRVLPAELVASLHHLMDKEMDTGGTAASLGCMASEGQSSSVPTAFAEATLKLCTPQPRETPAKHLGAPWGWNWGVVSY